MIYYYALGISLLSALITVAMLKYSLHKKFVDVPNHRSSHTRPTPKAGGLAIVISYTLGLVICSKSGLIDFENYQYLLLAGLIIAIVGFIDDVYSIASKKRLVFHFISALVIVYAFGGVSELSLFNWNLPLKWLAYPIAIVAIIWLLNLYNFMDGIDGIASVEAVSVAFSGAVILNYQYALVDVAIALLILGAAVLGFLFFNFPRAKIFLGDVGSAYLGVIFSGFAIISINHDPNLLWVWLVLLGTFIVDATFTLIRRILIGKRLDDAHRSHTYQKASRKCSSHMKVSSGVLVINIFWLFPIAWFIANEKIAGIIGTLIAYAPLILLALKLEAGKE